MYARPGLYPALYCSEGQQLTDVDSDGKNVRPAKASWSGVPGWFAISMRPNCRMGLW
jgi:hypothetical protein